MKSKALFTLCFLFTLTALVYAQETPAEGEKPPAEGQNAEAQEPPKSKLTAQERQRTELELKSSTMPELAVWCRSLGLSESGTKEELAKRIREHFGIPEPKDNDGKKKTLIIESAQSTEYFKVDVIDEDYARLKGGVHLILHDKDDVHNIKADEVLFNRTRNIITASGKVEYIKTKGETTEIFRGETITVNIDDWDSVFLNGDSEKTLESENTAYRFEGTVISRSYDDVMILRKARITNAKNEEALWSIRGTKLWLLPGSDFAVFNAVLSVGEIPVLYLPFFYYSADDLIFHPVIGYRTKEGGFVQTTTYILGHPKADTTENSSITKILGNSDDMEKVHNGIFLRSTGKKEVNPDSRIFKVLADYYVNLGLYTGLDITLPQAGILNSFDLSLGAGFSRTISQLGGGYTPYIPNEDGVYDGSVEWNKSNFFSQTVPFRYRFKTQSSLRGKYGGLSWSLPFYSDPFIDKDFYLNRAETMDWFKMIQPGADNTDDTSQDIGTYQWQVNGNISPSVSSLSPYVSSLSLSNLSTSLAFKILDDKKNTYPAYQYNPGKQFFAPDKYIIYNASGSIAGTPLTIGKKTNAEKKEAEKTEPEDPLKGIGAPRPPWENSETASEKKTTVDNLAPPALSKTFDLPRSGNAKFYIGYQLSPSGSTELQFMSGQWKTYEDINWNEIQSISSSFSGNGSITFGLDHSEGLYSNSLRFSGSGTWRDYNYLNEEAEAYHDSSGNIDQKKIDDAKKYQYAQTNYSTLYTYNTTVRPLYKDPVFGQSNLQYALEGTLVKSKPYDSTRTVQDGPELRPQWGTFKKEQTKDGEVILGIRSHRITSNLVANVMDNMQNLTVSADLPPLDPLIQTKATFRAWYSTTDAHMDFKKPETVLNEENIIVPNNRWIMDPLHLTETLTFGSISTFSHYMIMDSEDDFKVTTVTTSLTLWDFRASFTAVKLNRWKFEPDDPDHPSMGGKWVQLTATEEEPALQPRDLTLSYSKSTSELDIVKNRLSLSFNVSTSLFYDLQRYTNSNFQFSTGFTLKINKFMDLSLSGISKNAVIFRYFKGVPGMEKYTQMYPDGPQNNVLIDLIDSFNFFDTSKRKRSGFKMERFNIKAVHHLGDWDATLDVNMSPYLDINSTTRKYDINTEISFIVKWTAISEIKSDLKYEKRTQTWTKN